MRERRCTIGQGEHVVKFLRFAKSRDTAAGLDSATDTSPNIFAIDGPEKPRAAGAGKDIPNARPDRPPSSPAWRSAQLPGTIAPAETAAKQTNVAGAVGKDQFQANGSGLRTMGTDNTSHAGTGTRGAGAAPGSSAASGGAGPFSHAPPEGHARTISAVLGEIVWLMSQSSLHKQFFISDLEWFVMTPVLLQQFRTYYATDKPVGVVLWASVSDEVAERLAQGTTKLRPQDWKSGDKLWIVEVIAPFGGAEEMVKDLKDKVFPSRPVSFLAVTKDGKQVRVM